MGMKFKDTYISAVMYADDLMLLSGSKKGLIKQIEQVKKFGKSNGVRFNPQNTELIIFNR
jgi:hypothetical protein